MIFPAVRLSSMTGIIAILQKALPLVSSAGVYFQPMQIAIRVCMTLVIGGPVKDCTVLGGE